MKIDKRFGKFNHNYPIGSFHLGLENGNTVSLYANKFNIMTYEYLNSEVRKVGSLIVKKLK